MPVQRGDLQALWNEIDRLWAQNRQLREKVARSWELGVPDGIAVYNSGNISIGTGSWTALTFDSERRDDADFHSTVSNTSRLTVPAGKAGWYVIAGHISFAASGSGLRRYVSILINGSDRIAMQRGEPNATTPVQLSIATVYPLAAGDYAELPAYQDSGGNLNVIVDSIFSPEFRMVRVM